MEAHEPQTASHFQRSKPEGEAQSAFLPLLLLTLGLLGWFCFQATQLLRERAALGQSHAAQQTQVDQSQQLRNSLDALARDTANLADQGNPNAKLIVEQLRKRGITINPNAAPPAK